MQNIEYDTSDPRILVVFFHATPTDAEFEEYLGRTAARLYEGGTQKNALIISVEKGVPSTPAAQRKRQAMWLKEHADAIKARSAGTAFVFQSPAIRFVFSSILLVQPIPGEYTVVADLQEAKRWCRQQLAKAF